MVRLFIEEVMGEFGRQILYFYEANSLILNLIVLTYGVVMFMAWSALIKIYRYMVLLLVQQIDEQPNLDQNSKVKKIKRTVEMPWQKAVEAVRFPLVATIGGLVPMQKSVETMQALFDEDEMIVHALEVQGGANIRKIMPSYRRMRKRELSSKQKGSAVYDRTDF